MKAITNINWDFNDKLLREFEEGENYDNELKDVSFTYNGYDLVAQVSFLVTFCWSVSEGDRDTPRYVEMSCNDCELAIIELYDNNSDLYSLPIRELQDLTEYLTNDLKTEY